MIAIDTNVLVYCVDPRDPTKRQKARGLVNGLTGSSAVVLPWQVLVEYVNQLRYLHSSGIMSEADRDLAIRSARRLSGISCHDSRP